jgi:hypothetical protein
VTTDQRKQEFDHLREHVYKQPGDCAATRDLRNLLNSALTIAADNEHKLNRIEALEVVNGEFIDAAELHRILDKPIPAPIDHAANIRAKADGSGT